MKSKFAKSTIVTLAFVASLLPAGAQDKVDTVHISQPRAQDLGGHESGSWAPKKSSGSGGSSSSGGFTGGSFAGKGDVYGTRTGLGDGDFKAKGSGLGDGDFKGKGSGLGDGDSLGKGSGLGDGDSKGKGSGLGDGIHAGRGSDSSGSSAGGGLGGLGGGSIGRGGGGTGGPNNFPYGSWDPSKGSDPGWRPGDPGNPDPNNPRGRKNPPPGRPGGRGDWNPPPRNKYRDNGTRKVELTDDTELDPLDKWKPDKPQQDGGDSGGGGGVGATACPATTALAAAENFPEGAFGQDTSIPGGCYEHQNGKLMNPTSTHQIAPMTWPFTLPGYSTEGSSGAFGKKGNSLDKQIPKEMKHGSTPTASEVGAMASQLTSAAVSAMAQPGTWLQAAKEMQNTQTQQNADNSGDMAKQQAGCAIDFCRTALENFTVNAGNKWNKLRNELFMPMAILLLLPGAVATQAKATVAQGFPIFGEVSPIEGIYRSIVSIFLIPGTYLIVNYGIDVSNSIAYTIQSEYRRIFGTDMYRDAMCAQIRAYGVRLPSENLGHIPGKPGQMQGKGKGPRAKFEGKNVDVKLEDPCAGLYEAPAQKANEKVPYAVNSQRAAYNGMGSALAMTWNILCAFQMCYLYYLWFVGPIMAALWVWPVKQLREAFPNWCEGVITICFWSLFWNTTVLLMACFRGIDDTGTVIMSALNFLSTACVKFAFDFAGLVKAAGAEAGKMAEKAGKGGGSKGGSKGGSPGGSKSGGTPSHKGGDTPSRSPGGNSPGGPDLRAADSPGRNLGGSEESKTIVDTSNRVAEPPKHVVAANPGDGGAARNVTIPGEVVAKDATIAMPGIAVTGGGPGGIDKPANPEGIKEPPSSAQERPADQAAKDQAAKEQAAKEQAAKEEAARKEQVTARSMEETAKQIAQNDALNKALTVPDAKPDSKPPLSGDPLTTKFASGTLGGDVSLTSPQLQGPASSFVPPGGPIDATPATSQFSRIAGTDTGAAPLTQTASNQTPQDVYRQSTPGGEQQIAMNNVSSPTGAAAEEAARARSAIDAQAQAKALETGQAIQSANLNSNLPLPDGSATAQARTAIGDASGAMPVGGNSLPPNVIDVPGSTSTKVVDVAGQAAHAVEGGSTQMARAAADEAISHSAHTINSMSSGSAEILAQQALNTTSSSSYAKEAAEHSQRSAEPVITNSTPPQSGAGGAVDAHGHPQTVYRQQNQEIIEERRQAPQQNVRDAQKKQMDTQQKWFDKMSKNSQNLLPPATGKQGAPPQTQGGSKPPSSQQGAGPQQRPPSETTRQANETLSDVVSRGSTLRRSRDVTDMTEEEIELMKKLGHEESKQDEEEPMPLPKPNPPTQDA